MLIKTSRPVRRLISCLSLSISAPLRPMMMPGRDVWMMIFSLLAARSMSMCETPAPAKRDFSSFFSFRSSISSLLKSRLAIQFECQGD